MAQCDVTVLIPSHNPGSYLADALRSVFAQTYHGWKVILVDDASTDDSLELARPFLSTGRVRLVHNPVNLGQSKVQNAGLALVDTPYVVQLDADDWFLPQTLAVLVKEARQQRENVAVVSGNIRVSVQDGHGTEVRSFVRRGRVFWDRYEFLVAATSIWPRFYRTSALRSIGGWPTDDPYEGRHMEDLRILFRLVERYRLHWVDEVLYVHRRHGRNNSCNAHVYGEVLEWAVLDTLRRWGGNYRPVFAEVEPGWKGVVALVPLRPDMDLIVNPWYHGPPVAPGVTRGRDAPRPSPSPPVGTVEGGAPPRRTEAS